MRVQLIRSSLLRKELQLGHLRALLIEPVDGHAGGVTGRNRNVRFLSLPFHAINAEIEARIQVAIGGDDQLVALESRSLGLIRMRVPQLHNGVVSTDLRIFGLLLGERPRNEAGLPNNPFLAAFYDKYTKAFHLKNRRESRRASEGASMPHRSQEQEREHEQDINTLPQTAFADAHEILSDSTTNSKPTEAQTELIYGLYPRKLGKFDAKKAIRDAVRKVMAGDPDHSVMPLDDALDYLAQRVRLYERCVEGRDRKYIPYPASWFNAGSFWDDERDWNHNGRNSGKQSVSSGSALAYHRELLESSAT